MILILDAGHGGDDPGAVAGGVEEDNIALDIVQALVKIVWENHPAWVIHLTRDEDSDYLSPSERQALILEKNPTCAVSVHCNAFHSDEARGAEVIYHSDESRDLAEFIETTVSLNLGMVSRGVKHDDRDLGRGLTILRTADIPSVIVEPGFLTNERNRDILTQRTPEVAQAIFEGIEAWGEQEETENVSGLV